MTESSGRRKLADLLDKRAISPGAFAVLIGGSKSGVMGFRDGTFRPDAYYRAAIARVTDGIIHESDWLTDEEHARLNRLVKISSQQPASAT